MWPEITACAALSASPGKATMPRSISPLQRCTMSTRNGARTPAGCPLNGLRLQLPVLWHFRTSAHFPCTCSIISCRPPNFVSVDTIDCDSLSFATLQSSAIDEPITKTIGLAGMLIALDGVVLSYTWSRHIDNVCALHPTSAPFLWAEVCYLSFLLILFALID